MDPSTEKSSNSESKALCTQHLGSPSFIDAPMHRWPTDRHTVTSNVLSFEFPRNAPVPSTWSSLRVSVCVCNGQIFGECYYRASEAQGVSSSSVLGFRILFRDKPIFACLVCVFACLACLFDHFSPITPLALLFSAQNPWLMPF